MIKLQPSPALQVVSCLDDDNQSTRLVSCKVMRLILLERPSTVDSEIQLLSIAVQSSLIPRHPES